jgi:hypothetical protein
LWISMRWLADEQRGMLFKAVGKRYMTLIHKLQKQIYGGV